MLSRMTQTIDPVLVNAIKASAEANKKAGNVTKKGEPVYKMTKSQMLDFQRRARAEAWELVRDQCQKAVLNDYAIELFVGALYLGLRVLERDHRDSVKKTKYREFGNFLADFAIGVLNENDKSDFRDVKEMADYIFEKTGCRIQIQDCETGRVLPLNPYQRSCEEGWGV